MIIPYTLFWVLNALYIVWGGGGGGGLLLIHNQHWGQEPLGYHYLNLCSEDESVFYGFGTT